MPTDVQSTECALTHWEHCVLRVGRAWGPTVGTSSALGPGCEACARLPTPFLTIPQRPYKHAVEPSLSLSSCSVALDLPLLRSQASPAPSTTRSCVLSSAHPTAVVASIDRLPSTLTMSCPSCLPLPPQCPLQPSHSAYKPRCRVMSCSALLHDRTRTPRHTPNQRATCPLRKCPQTDRSSSSQ